MAKFIFDCMGLLNIIKYNFIMAIKRFLALLLFFIFIIPASLYGEEALKIGRMKVSIWPKYDTSGVLAVHEGCFADKNAFPAQITFIFTKGVTKLTDSCSLSPKGMLVPILSPTQASDWTYPYL